jgi:hypothetical protein
VVEVLGLSFRELYEEIRDYEGGDVYAGVVRRHALDEERRWLEAFGMRRGKPIPEAAAEELWQLYALSRVVDVLRLDADISEFMESLGLQRIEQGAFHPFFHEVVSIGDAFAEVWPGYMLGPLVIARAGVVATGFVKEVAEHSTMYWAYRRANRPTEDLSMGWGSNSQWRTSFRRDYLLDGMLYYNVDGRGGRGIDDDLDAAEKLELLRHRCFVRCRKRHDDRWPYDDTYREPL